MSLAAVDDALRRRSSRSSVAGSLLLTVLAEHVLQEGAIWQESLVQCLETLGHTRTAGRQATARAVGDDWLRSERVGRRARMHLTERSVSTLTQGTEQILHFGQPHTWDGKWLVLTVSVSGAQDELRRRLRTLLAWHGFGPIGNGVWINPWTDREPLVPQLFSVDGEVTYFCFRSELVSEASASQLAQTAWDLQAIAQGYEQFIARFSDARPKTPREVFVADTELSHAWRHFLFVDPGLPQELLPHDWPGRRAYRLFHDHNAAWRPIAHQYVTELEQQVNGANNGSGGN